uniref:LIM zinc-binding domain-containing protein n=8 Tax=Solanum TaxID=4107 RepID=A0A3Q7GMU8_SOLLC
NKLKIFLCFFFLPFIILSLAHSPRKKHSLHPPLTLAASQASLHQQHHFFFDLPIVKEVGGSDLGVEIMSFTGTQQKCKACEKTVYPVELLSADGISYHKSCFKCTHCKGTLKLSSYSSMEGVLYCKPHFEQLYKESGNFNKNFQSPVKSAEKLTPMLTKSPSKAAGMFSGTQEKCATCGKTAYPLEKVTVENQSYHKSCFKCSHGGCSLNPSNYAALDGILYCKPHFSQLFKEKGSYNHLIKSASMKRPAATVPDS